MKKYIKPNTKTARIENTAFMNLSINNEVVSPRGQLSKENVGEGEQTVWFN